MHKKILVKIRGIIEIKVSIQKKKIFSLILGSSEGHTTYPNKFLYSYT